jgi:hypothetical protein
MEQQKTSAPPRSRSREADQKQHLAKKKKDGINDGTARAPAICRRQISARAPRVTAKRFLLDNEKK